MDLLKLATDIQAWFDTQEFSYTVGEGNDELNGVFLLTFGNEFSGFVSYDDNTDDLGFPTVSAAIFLADVTEVDADLLRQLLTVNAALYAASLVCARHDDGTHDLYMQMRLAAEGLVPEQLAEALNSLLAQIQHFLGPMMEPEGEAGEGEAAEAGEADAE